MCACAHMVHVRCLSADHWQIFGVLVGQRRWKLWCGRARRKQKMGKECTEVDYQKKKKKASAEVLGKEARCKKDCVFRQEET